MAIISTVQSARLQLRYGDARNNCTYSGVRADLGAANANAFIAGVAALQNDEPEAAYLVAETLLADSED